MEKKAYEISKIEFIYLADDVITSSSGNFIPIPEDTDVNEGEWDWD